MKRRNSSMAHFLLVLLSFILFVPFSVFAETSGSTVFGPQIFERHHGKPFKEQISFTSPVDYGTLEIINGPEDEGSAWKRVSAANIELNGKVIFGPDSFNQKEGILKTAVELLEGDNTLTVELRGKPGGAIALSITSILLSAPGITPGGIPPSTPTDVTFTAALLVSSIPPQRVQLEWVKSNGEVVPLGDLVDNGLDADLTAGDRVYSGTFQIAHNTEGKFYYRVSMIYNDKTCLSEKSHLTVTSLPIGPRPSDPSKIVYDPKTSGPVYADELLVGFTEEASLNRITQIISEINQSLKGDAVIMGSIPGFNLYQIQISGNGKASGVYAAAKLFEQYGEVEFAEPNGIMHGDEIVPDGGFDQWGAMKIRADEAWVVANLAGRANPIVVAVLDTGYLPHTDLDGVFMPGIDFIDNDDDPEDELPQDHIYFGHGTKVAGVIGAKHNGEGITGIAYGCRILPVRVSGEDGASWLDAASGINYASEMGAKIINMSFGGSSGSDTLHSAVSVASQRGVLLISTAGNTGDTKKNYPGAYEEVFCVGGTAPDDTRHPDSCHGSLVNGFWVDIAAPYTAYTTTPDGYGYAYGTSYSAPYVSGAAALVWSKHSEFSATMVRRRLENTAKYIGWDLGAGRVDVFEAIFNGGFEIKDLEEWTASGMCRSVTDLGPNVHPLQGNRMAYLSTGPSTGLSEATLEKVFWIQRLPLGTTHIPIQFNYMFVTDEFYNRGDELFDDFFEVTVTMNYRGIDETTVLKTISVYDEENWWVPDNGINLGDPSRLTGIAGWIRVTTEIPLCTGHPPLQICPYKPRPATLKITVKDVGDDVYDSALLIDRIMLKHPVITN